MTILRLVLDITKQLFSKSTALAVLLTLFGVSSNAYAEIRVLVAGGDLNGPLATEEIFANGDLVGSVDRPSWTVYRELTTEQIVNNYDVVVIP